jgi:hypothetical protein
MLVLDRLLTSVKDACTAFPDKRKGGDASYTMADIGLAGFPPLIGIPFTHVKAASRK